jgi:hypothetical protein
MKYHVEKSIIIKKEILEVKEFVQDLDSWEG